MFEYSKLFTPSPLVRFRARSRFPSLRTHLLWLLLQWWWNDVLFVASGFKWALLCCHRHCHHYLQLVHCGQMSLQWVMDVFVCFRSWSRQPPSSYWVCGTGLQWCKAAAAAQCHPSPPALCRHPACRALSLVVRTMTIPPSISHGHALHPSTGLRSSSPGAWWEWGRPSVIQALPTSRTISSHSSDTPGRWARIIPVVAVGFTRQDTSRVLVVTSQWCWCSDPLTPQLPQSNKQSANQV